MILFRNIKNYHPANFLIVIFVGLVVWMKSFINYEASGIYYDANPMPLYNWIYNGLSDFVLLNKMIAFTIVLFQAIIINGVTNQYNLLGFRSYLPGIFYVLIAANLPEFQLLHPLLMANLLFLVSWERIASITEKSNTFKAFFNASFFLGLATLFYPNYLYLIIVVIWGTVLNRISHPREFIMIVLGFITVWYFYFTINYILFDKFQISGVELEFEIIREPFENFRPGQIVFFLYVFVLMLLASFQVSTYVSNMKIQIRRNLKMLFVWFLICLGVFLFTPSSFELIYTFAIPVALLFAIFLINLKNRWLPEIIWIFFFGITLVNQYFPELF